MKHFRFSVFCNGYELGAIVGDEDCIRHTLSICGLKCPARLKIKSKPIPIGHPINNFPVDYRYQEIAQKAHEVGLLSYQIIEQLNDGQVLKFEGISIGRQKSFQSTEASTPCKAYAALAGMQSYFLRGRG